MMWNESGQTEGCVAYVIVMIAFIVTTILVGGLWRTEVSLSFGATTNGSGETSFSENLTARHWVGGLIKGEQPNLAEVLGKYRQNGNQVSQISIMTRHTFVNNLVTGITLGIYCPVTVTVSGKIAEAKSHT